MAPKMTLIRSISSLAKIISAEILLPNFAKVKVDLKADGSWLTVADTLAHQKLTKQLTKLVNYPVLSEELDRPTQQQILQSKPLNYWCVDPLDGTSNFAQGIPYWCTSIALIESGKVVLAVVYDPNRDECFAASESSKTTLNGVEIDQLTKANASLQSAMGLIDFKRLNKQKALALVSNPPYRSQRSFGASALDFCWIAANRCQVYLHGQQKLWDYAAGLLILKNSGGCAQTFDQQAIFQNDLPSKTVLAATEPSLMKQWNNYFRSI